MGKYLVTMGDFLKNAGIVGLNYMLDMSDAESGKDYGIKMQNRPVDGLELSRDYGLTRISCSSVTGLECILMPVLNIMEILQYIKEY